MSENAEEKNKSTQKQVEENKKVSTKEKVGKNKNVSNKKEKGEIQKEKNQCSTWKTECDFGIFRVIRV